MSTAAAVIDSLNAKIAQLQSELDETLERAATAERAWAEALNRARTAEEEAAWLRKELEQEAE